MRKRFKKYQFYKLSITALVCCIQILGAAQIYTISDFPQNSDETDFSAVFLGDDIVFCSSRSRKTTNFNQDSIEVFYTDLFQARYNGSGSYLPAEPLRGDVNGFFNEGHATFSADGKTMYYTANLIKKKGKSSKTDEYKLGIFIAEHRNGSWNKVGEFQYNSPNGKYSVAHPFLSIDGNTLYFASNKPGGYGGSDIYKCLKTIEGWGEPENLGENVNDEGNEFFPFVNSYGTLYFTTDGRYDSEGMDIFSCYPGTNGDYDEAIRLNNTINSPFDELAYFEKNGTNNGLFSSNRNSERDDIFMFTKTDEQNRLCVESRESIMCYRFIDENLQKLEKSMPIVYLWDLGDGTEMKGDTIEHCYKSSGTYSIVLNAIDTLTKMTFSRISEARITITNPNDPVIFLPDTVYIGKIFEASLFAENFEEFPIEEIKWYLNDGVTFSGKTIHHHVSNTGSYQFRCEIIGGKNSRGITNRYCVYKNFSCLTPPHEAIIVEPMVEEHKEQPLEVRMNTKSFGNYSIKDLDIGDNFYMLIIAESVNPISFEDSLFQFIEGEISEIKTPTGYIYAIERKENWKELYATHNTLKDKGLKTSYAEVFNLKTYDEGLVRKGHYEPVEALAIEVMPIEKETTKLDTLSTTSHHTAVSKVSTTHKKETVTTPDEVNKINPDPKPENLAEAPPVTKTATESKPNRKNDSNSSKHDEHNKSLKATGSNTHSTSQTDKATKAQKPISVESETSHRKSITLYHLVIESSNKRIPLEGEFFRNIGTEIAEIKANEGYKYTILTASDSAYLNVALAELQSKGYRKARIEKYDLQEFSDNLIRIGKHSMKLNLEQLNKEFAKLPDIKFDYNSSSIRPESHATLDYIASVMTLESDFVLKVNAHACNTGNSVSNKKLSDKRAQSVIEYYISKGISRERLIAQGYGDSKPAASNFTVDGRSMNRRVEFVIVYDGNE